MKYLFLGLCLLLFATCRTASRAGQRNAPLEAALTNLKSDPLCAKVLKNKDLYEIQVIYTQIDRDANGRASFRSFHYNVDSTCYFYPASMVKMPLALLSLEKINNLRRSGYPRLKKETWYRMDSLRAFQHNYAADPTAPDGKPSIAHDIRNIFVVSDNLAYNHLFEFLGRDYINQTLRDKGYSRTGITHRFEYSGRDNRYAAPMTFYEPTVGILKIGERFEEKKWDSPQRNTIKGKGYYLGDSLVQRPFDMKSKNWFALGDMEKMIRSVMFPDAVPAENRFQLTESDYRFLWHYMGIFPRECDFPRFKTEENPDGYVKFFLFGDSKIPQSGTVRSFNKVGEAYGTLTDAAYVVDFDNKVEFILAATILCNSDGIFNDDQYDYEAVGFPFLARLGREIHAQELRRSRAFAPDLSPFKTALEQQQ